MFRATLMIISVGLLMTSLALESIVTDDDGERMWEVDRELQTNHSALVKVFTHQRRRLYHSTLAEGVHHPELLISVEAFNKTFLLELKLNRYLFGSLYHEKSVQIGGHRVDGATNDASTHCYYVGVVSQQSQSTVAVSTCSGLRGLIVLDGEAYHIEPMSNTLNGEHKVYRQLDSELPVGFCGNQVFSTIQRVSTQLSRASRMRRDAASFGWPQDLQPQTKIIELYIVNDYSQFQALGSNLSRVILRTKELVNVASSFYQPLNVYLCLVGVETWTNASMINVNYTDANMTLNNFAVYRQLSINPYHSNDNAQLITSRAYAGGVVLGLGYVDTMCSDELSASIVSDVSSTPGSTAAVMAHEMGHNFGMLHDTQYNSTCSCSDPIARCIMFPSASNRPSTQWSQCSKNQLTSFFNNDIYFCLSDFHGKTFDSTPVCGNGFVEANEQCDCGASPATVCNATCCNNVTCQLIGSAQCAFGRCCDLSTCSMKPIATVCRADAGPCDLAEYCSGINNTCPSDVYMRDGVDCTVGQENAYCYNGSCKTATSQCQLWWGSTSSNSASDCYTAYNVDGQANGHCGIINSTIDSYKTCTKSNAACGLLQCNYNFTSRSAVNSTKLLSTATIYRSGLRYPNGTIVLCTSTMSDVAPDLSMVPNGARCGDKQMCFDQTCVNVAVVLNQTSCPNCNSRGVCNNIGQCHCEIGYAPPDCTIFGNGGSYHSNPISLLQATVQAATNMLSTTSSPRVTSSFISSTTTSAQINAITNVSPTTPNTLPAVTSSLSMTLSHASLSTLRTLSSTVVPPSSTTLIKTLSQAMTSSYVSSTTLQTSSLIKTSSPLSPTTLSKMSVVTSALPMTSADVSPISSKASSSVLSSSSAPPTTPETGTSVTSSLPILSSQIYSTTLQAKPSVTSSPLAQTKFITMTSAVTSVPPMTSVFTSSSSLTPVTQKTVSMVTFSPHITSSLSYTNPGTNGPTGADVPLSPKQTSKSPATPQTMLSPVVISLNVSRTMTQTLSSSTVNTSKHWHTTLKTLTSAAVNSKYVGLTSKKVQTLVSSVGTAAKPVSSLVTTTSSRYSTESSMLSISSADDGLMIAVIVGSLIALLLLITIVALAVFWCRSNRAQYNKRDSSNRPTSSSSEGIIEFEEYPSGMSASYENPVMQMTV